MSDKKTHEFVFDSWGAMVDHAENAPCLITSGRDIHGSRVKERDSWAGGLTFEETVKTAHEGWEQGAKEAKGLYIPMFESISSIIERQELIYDVEGHGLDIGRYVDNEPECWQRYETVQVDGAGHKIIRVVVNIGASCAVSAETITARGGAIHALIQLLEYAGHRCELWANCCVDGRHEGGFMVSKVLVKKADQNIDDGRLAFALAHPGMFRRLQFSVWETAPLDMLKACGIFPYTGYGWPAEDKKAGDGKEADIYIGTMLWGEIRWNDKKAVKDWLMSELEKQGVKLNREALKV